MKTAMMKTSLVLSTLVSLSALTGCIQPDGAGLDETEEGVAVEETGEAVQALDPMSPEALTYFRLRFKHTTELVTQGQRQKATCFEPIDLAKSAPVVQRDCNTGMPGPSDDQSFYLANPTARQDGRRMLVLAQDPSRCLMIAGHWAGQGALDNGAALVVYTCDPGRENQWFYLDMIQPSGYSVIRASHSGISLSVPGSSTDSNAVVYQYNVGAIPADAFLIFRDKGGSNPAPWL